MRKYIIISAFVITTIAVLAFCLIDHIPPRSFTETRMEVLKRRVLQYAHTHNELPSSLTVLPAINGYDNSVKDGWKHDIIFETSVSSIVTFRSFGPDGVAGGSGKDADIIRMFPARDTHGHWSIESVKLEDASVK